MPLNHINIRALAQQGLVMLRNGDARAAIESFEKIVAAGHADASICLGLAYACLSLGDNNGLSAALDKALAIEPQNIRALMMKADCLASAGDDRAATTFYLAVVKAATLTMDLPIDLQNEVTRAQRKCDQSVASAESSMRDQLAQLLQLTGTSGHSTARFEESLDILFGKKKIYFQEPRYYFFPGLPQIQFYNRTDFPWLDKVEAATAAIRAELIDVMKGETPNGYPTASAFKPYVQAHARRPHNPQNEMLNNPDWSAFYLWKDGELVAENAARCPQTIAALADVPMPRVGNRSPSILFSLLRPGAHIPPHNGFINTRLIVHLPVIVPDKCTFRVGNETRPWVEGQAWLFDDTIEHEAWNDSNEVRVILLFEIWRPELTLQERELVNAMFETIDATSGAKTSWAV